jgi:acyl carrier protein phosphodiesterase
MTNAQWAMHYRAVSELYSRLAALDQRQGKLEAFKGEQATIDSTRKQVQDELDKLISLEQSSGPIPSGIPIPPAQPPV